MSARVAVAVVSWNNRDLLAACLRSLEADARAGLAEVWVVDNASTDGSADLVREAFPWVRLIASQENLGYGPAINLVARASDAPWIVAANDDIEVTPGALAALLDAGEADPRAGAVSPRLVLGNGTTQHSAYPFPSVPLAVLFNLGVLQRSRALADRMCLEGFWDGGRARVVPWAIAAFLVIRRSAFDAIGGFDDEQWIFAEDLDLGWRLCAGGWHTRYVPDAIVHHVGSAATTSAFGDARTQRWMTATYAWMLRRRGVGRTAAYSAASLAGAAARTDRRWLRLHWTGLREGRAAARAGRV